ncbi:MAG: lanthionine synthetase LanC family protein [Halioglobus sp.]
MHNLSRSTFNTYIIAVLLILSSYAEAGFAQTKDRDYLDYALGAERWLNKQTVITDAGKIWRSEGEKNDHPVTNGNITTGSSGVILFYLELYQQTGDGNFLKEAEEGASYLMATTPSELYVEKNLNGLELHPSLNLPKDSSMTAYTVANGLGHPNQVGLNGGVSGIGFTLGEMYRVTGKEEYRRAALDIVELLLRDVHVDAAGKTWGSTAELASGDAGAGLFLLYAHKELGHNEAGVLARAVGDSILARAKESNGGVMWSTASAMGGAEYHNFDHGTSGVGYFLATLYQHSGDKRYLNGATSAGAYLTNIAYDNGLIPHRFPDSGVPFLGRCNGPAGTNHLFEKLALEAPSKQWSSIIERSDRTIMDADILNRKQPVSLNNVSQCCGSAGVADYFLTKYMKTKDAKYLAFAKSMTEDIIEHASDDENGLSWSHLEEHKDAQIETGYKQGAAGIGMHFLRMHAVVNDRELSVRLLDDRY